MHTALDICMPTRTRSSDLGPFRTMLAVATFIAACRARRTLGGCLNVCGVHDLPGLAGKSFVANLHRLPLRAYLPRS